MVLFCSKRQMMGGCIQNYKSKKTNTAEEKYSNYELEVLAIVAALKKLRVYLGTRSENEASGCLEQVSGQRVMSDTPTFRLKNAQSDDEGIVPLKALLGSGNLAKTFEKKLDTIQI
ncbi:hypothetical protein TNIN_162811 [Trichonephila inaurata madagascariensis]|uniref:Reverse transcriptase/retrotransposon-derived protein RNase H-like domain-containing protein n=1 Tax=Trichonephila inaurata madagascariensis TaxID=2747483 RepID=A0A8X6XPX4_9ARAC|nr:hypothetical protein TNIN_162811 [Trichonephila inaurata madagascariensis]